MKDAAFDFSCQFGVGFIFHLGRSGFKKARVYVGIWWLWKAGTFGTEGRAHPSYGPTIRAGWARCN